MQTEISPYNATEYRDVLARLALQRANIMHLVDLKRGGYSPRRTELRIGRLTARPQSGLKRHDNDLIVRKQRGNSSMLSRRDARQRRTCATLTSLKLLRTRL